MLGVSWGLRTSTLWGATVPLWVEHLLTHLVPWKKSNACLGSWLQASLMRMPTVTGRGSSSHTAI